MRMIAKQLACTLVVSAVSLGVSSVALADAASVRLSSDNIQTSSTVTEQSNSNTNLTVGQDPHSSPTIGQTTGPSTKALVADGAVAQVASASPSSTSDPILTSKTQETLAPSPNTGILETPSGAPAAAETVSLSQNTNTSRSKPLYAVATEASDSAGFMQPVIVAPEATPVIPSMPSAPQSPEPVNMPIGTGLFSGQLASLAHMTMQSVSGSSRSNALAVSLVLVALLIALTIALSMGEFFGTYVSLVKASGYSMSARGVTGAIGLLASEVSRLASYSVCQGSLFYCTQTFFASSSRAAESGFELLGGSL